jgi:hypothetical protein
MIVIWSIAFIIGQPFNRAIMKLQAALLVVFMAQSSLMIHAPTPEGLVWENERTRLGAVLASLTSDLDKTTFLRTYCGELIDVGRIDDQTSRFYQSIDFESLRLSLFYPLFKRHRIPGTCGTTTYFYIKLLQCFGFNKEL